MSDNKLPEFKDITDLEENDRIKMIGEYVMTQRKVTGFFVDDDPGKSDRYVEKLLAQFPGIRIIYHSKKAFNDPRTGESTGAIFVKVGPPAN